MPQEMTYHPEAVVVGAKVYVGCGTGPSSETVMEYDIAGDTWSVLPEYEYFWFGMTCARNKLVLVGGVAHSVGGERTSLLGVWDEEKRVWSHDMPAMPTARSGPSVVTYKDRWIAVAGGFDTKQAHRSIVEILDILTSYWHTATSLPIRQYKMSSAIIGNTWYLLGGYPQTNGCICVCLDDLIHQAVFQLPSPVLWHSIPDTPAVHKSTALGHNGALLAIGVSHIHIYNSSTNSWAQAAELPCTRRGCASTVLPNGDIFTAGGALLSIFQSRVDIGRINP